MNTKQLELLKLNQAPEPRATMEPARPAARDPGSRSLVGTAYSFAIDVATGRHSLSRLVAPLLWVVDAVLCGLIIWKIPYTEIDWVAYMQQVAQFIAGEHDYALIKGDTGPLVYPAAHVYTFTGLYYITDEGKDILFAQQIFAVLYLATLALVMACYRKAQAPPYLCIPLILSKRLHSLFVLRCFNDCFAVFFLWFAIYLFQRRSWTLGVVAYSLGLGTKMTLLVSLPAVGIILFLGRGFKGSLRLAGLMVQVQILLGLPFLAYNPRSYLARAFELTRQFKYEWTVNMRMVSEEVFLSRGLAITLLVLHVATLVVFINWRWLKPAGVSLTSLLPSFVQFQAPFSEEEERKISRKVDPRFVLTTMLAANNIGLLFARSLHYQFYAYLNWSTPFLMWSSGVGNGPVVLSWLLQEWAWNKFPSTPSSSLVVVGVLGLTVVATWLSTEDDTDGRDPSGSSRRGD